MNDWLTVFALFLTVLGLLFGFAKWFINWAENRDAEQETHFNQTIQQHAQELKNVHARIDKHVGELTDTRDQLHRDYVRHDEIETWRREIREDFKAVFQKMGGIDRSVNQLIGIVKGKTTND